MDKTCYWSRQGHYIVLGPTTGTCPFFTAKRWVARNKCPLPSSKETVSWSPQFMCLHQQLSTGYYSLPFLSLLKQEGSVLRSSHGMWAMMSDVRVGWCLADQGVFSCCLHTETNPNTDCIRLCRTAHCTYPHHLTALTDRCISLFSKVHKLFIPTNVTPPSHIDIHLYLVL